METAYPVLQFYDNHWKANAFATVIYSQWLQLYDKRMNPHPDDKNSGNNGNDNDGNDHIGDEPEAPPQKKPKTTIIIDDKAHLSNPETHINNEGLSS